MTQLKNAPRHFLDIDQLDSSELRSIIDRGAAYKKGEPPRGIEKPLAGKSIALVFEKPSTRTRVSFEVGIHQLGGQPIVLEPSGTQLGRGETIADTARVLSRYVDAIMIRTTLVEKLLELADYATVPVINGLTDRTHPCQLMADILTFEERRGPITGKKVTWVGDGNNMAATWVQRRGPLRLRALAGLPGRAGAGPGALELGQGGGRLRPCHTRRDRRQSPARIAWSPTPGSRWATTWATASADGAS